MWLWTRNRRCSFTVRKSRRRSIRCRPSRTLLLRQDLPRSSRPFRRISLRTNLTSVTLPSTTRSLNYAFSGCGKLQSVTVTGVVIKGMGYGCATVKKVGSFPVTLGIQVQDDDE